MITSLHSSRGSRSPDDGGFRLFKSSRWGLFVMWWGVLIAVFDCVDCLKRKRVVFFMVGLFGCFLDCSVSNPPALVLFLFRTPFHHLLRRLRSLAVASCDACDRLRSLALLEFSLRQLACNPLPAGRAGDRWRWPSPAGLVRPAACQVGFFLWRLLAATLTYFNSEVF